MQNLDLREILKVVPKGTKLYSTTHGDVRFDYVDLNSKLYSICCRDIHGTVLSFTKEGKWRYSCPGECVLFPSSEQRDWNKFKIGDEIYNKLQEAGYFLNSETNLVEKYKFNIGDKVQDKVTKQIYTIYDIEHDKYKVKENIQCYLFAEYQEQYELYQEKFDINNLKPYDKVLVRCGDSSVWEPQLFSRLDINLKNHANKFVVIGICSMPQCIPYEGNEHLDGTTNDCDEYYKNW